MCTVKTGWKHVLHFTDWMQWFVFAAMVVIIFWCQMILAKRFDMIGTSKMNL